MQITGHRWISTTDKYRFTPIEEQRELSVKIILDGEKNNAIIIRKFVVANNTMKKHRQRGLDFEVDKLTNSIENVVTGDSFPTDITIISREDLIAVTKKNGWQFDWKYEFKQPQRDVFKLTIVNNPAVIQGLVSLEVKTDHVYMHLVESAPFNKGKTKVYSGAPGNLVAYACKLSFQRGYEGNVAFVSKTRLVNHYIQTLGASHFGRGLMTIEEESALKLIGRYFKS